MDTTETPMIEATAPTEPPPNGNPDLHVTPELALLARELLVNRRAAEAKAAIASWETKARRAAELAKNASDDENKAFQEPPPGTTEAMRKAHAKVASAKSRLEAEHAAIDARAAERLVDLLVGGGRS